MSRDPSGIYTVPAGTDGIPDTTIESAKYNGFVHDVEQDLNIPRPIVAGGTGATSASQARDNLDAEVAMQTVTNYDSHPWEPGSFKSDVGATNSPDGAGAATNVYGGTVQVFSPTAAVVEARNLSTGVMYMRKKIGGVWGAWTADSGSGAFVLKAGDTMTGNLTINTNGSPFLNLAKNAASGFRSEIYGSNGELSRWVIQLGNGTTEAGGNTGSDFAIGRYADGPPNTLIGSVMTIARSSGTIGIGTSPGSPFPGSGNTITGINMLQGGFFFVSTAGHPGTELNINLDGMLVACRRSGVQVGSITVNTTSTAFNTSSDRRLKEDLKDFDAGPIIDGIKVYDFAWKATGKRAHGVVAQEAIEAYAPAVTHAEDLDQWQADYSKYVPLLLQEIKALRARVAALEGGAP